MPEGLVYLGSWCFQNNDFDTIRIPYGVKEIYDNVFNKSGTVTVYFEISEPRSTFYDGWDASVNPVWDNGGYIKDVEVNGYKFALYNNGVRTYAKLIEMDESLTVFDMPLMIEDIYVAEWDEQVIKNATNNFVRIVVPEGTKHIVDQEIFKYYKETLLEVNFPSTLTYITDNICSGLSKLERVTFAEGVKVIGQGAFYGTALTRVELPASVIYLRSMCFHRGEKITEYVFNNPDLKFEDGEIFWHGAVAEVMKLPEHLEVIENRNLLWAVTRLLIIPNTVRRIEHANISKRWISYILFAGTSSQWANIEIVNEGNDDDNVNDNIYFYSESAPTDDGKYWHYDGSGNPVFWEKISVRLLDGNRKDVYSAFIYPGQSISYYSTEVSKKETNEYYYVFTGWDRSLDNITESCTINAVFKAVHKLAKVVFIDGSTIVQSSLVNVGEAVEYTGETPARAPSNGCTNEFVGWSTNKYSEYADFNLSYVNGNAILYPIFNQVPIKHHVTFKNYDGTILYEGDVNEGSVAKYEGLQPVKEKAGDMYYVFSGWDKPLENILEDTVFTAIYVETEQVLTVTFKNYDDSVLYETIVMQGDSINYYGETPVKDDGSGKEYIFVGWSKSLENIQESIVVYAQFMLGLDDLSAENVYVSVDPVTGLTQIAWDAQLSSKEAVSFSSSGKLSGNDYGYVLYTINSEKEMDVRIWSKYSYTRSGMYNRETGEGQQSLWYDFDPSLTGWKYILTINGVEIDQSTQSYNLGNEVVDMQYLTYADFGDTYPIETPWVQIHLKQGQNTIKIMRHKGYGLSFTYFRLVEVA